jgi:hypothetical protein
MIDDDTLKQLLRIDDELMQLLYKNCVIKCHRPSVVIIKQH